MDRPPLALKTIANDLACSFGTKEGARILSLIRSAWASAAANPLALPAAASKNGNDPASRRIGIWEPRLKNNEVSFVRAAVPGEPTSFWARCGIIQPKRNKKRVVLLGESVARGFFYDPSFNPASALQTLLRSGGSQEMEVVDLARSNLTFEPLIDILQASAQLEPDALVVFAGNNWRTPPDFKGRHGKELADLLRRSGWRAVKDEMEQALRGRVRDCFDALGSFARKHNIPVVFVLPEFNLVDWHDDCRSPPLCSSRSTAEWLRSRADGERALAAGEFREADECGHRMLQIDRGTTPSGPRIIGRAKLGAGDVGEARRFFEMARDGTICLPRDDSPRCYSTIHTTARSLAPSSGVALIDLPRAFEDYSGGDLPGRRLFHDYCHLTVEATVVAMSLAAERLLPLLGNTPRSAAELRQTPIDVAPKVIGEAHFLSAIHNANWGQGNEIVRYHCHKALEYSPGVARAMRLLLDFHVRRAPSCLCKAFEELCLMQSLSALDVIFDHANPLEDKFLNPVLITEMADALKAHGASVDGEVHALLNREHGVGPDGVELTGHLYSLHSRIVPVDQDRYGYFRASEPVSAFRLVIDEQAAVRFRLTFRVKHAKEDDRIEIMANGKPVASLKASSNWATQWLTPPAANLRAGINLVEIRWPLGDWSLSQWVDSVADRLVEGQTADVTPIFGEIHSFRAISVSHRESSPQDALRGAEVSA